LNDIGRRELLSLPNVEKCRGTLEISAFVVIVSSTASSKWLVKLGYHTTHRIIPNLKS